MKNTTEIIDRYLNNELSVTEKENFEQELKNNSELVREIKLHSEIGSFLSDTETEKLQNQLNLIYENEIKNKRSLLVQYRKKIIYAAAFLLLTIGFSSIYYFETKRLSNNEIYQKYAQIYNYGINSRGDSATILNEAMSLYESGSYRQAIRVFETAVSNGCKLNNGIYLCIGISYTEISDFDKARFYFEKITENDPLFHEQAQWYLGLMYLKADNSEKAKEFFQKISKNTTHYKNQDAKEIMELLSK